MGRRGPKPTPTVVQLAKGDPGKRAKRQAAREPKFSDGLPTRPPSWLPKRGQIEYRRIMRELRKVPGLAQSVDRAIIEEYCLAYADLREAQEQIKKHGTFQWRTTMGGDRYRQNSPFVAHKKDAAKRLKDACARLGFSPADRARVQVPEDGADSGDPLDVLMHADTG